MAIDKAVDSAQLNADLTAVADAIRSKGGTSGKLTFPGGFVDAVGAIQSGGGGQWGLGDNTVPTSISAMFYALENGTAKTGAFTLTSILSSEDFELVFDTGLESVTGMLIYLRDWQSNAIENNNQCIGLAIFDGSKTISDDSNEVYNGSLYVFGLSVLGKSVDTVTGKLGYGALKLEGGAVYGITGNAWNNRLYSVLTTNVPYSWIAW